MAVPDERQQLLNHILTMDRRCYRYLHAGGGRAWAQTDLTMPQLKVLYLVAGSEGITMTQVARALGMTLSTATGVVDRLVGQGLVRREHALHDRRLVLLRPTEAGTAHIEQLTRASREQLRLLLERLTLDDLRTVARAFDVLYEAAMQLAEAEAHVEVP